MKETQELVEAPPAEIDLFAAYSDPLAELEEKNSKVKFDITTYEGETKCKKYIAKVGQFRIGVESLRKSLKAEFLEGGRAVDKKAKLYQERIAAIDAVHSVPLKELENKRIAEVLEKREAEQAAEKAIEDKRLADLEEREAKMAAKEAEQQAVEDAAQASRDAAERKEELEAAALIATENAKLKATQDAIDAEAKAKQDVLDAIAETQRQAKVKADRLAKEVADKYEVEQAEQNKLAEENRKRIANQDHRREFNNLAAEKLTLITKDLDMSIAIVTAIVKNEIDNVKMLY